MIADILLISVLLVVVAAIVARRERTVSVNGMMKDFYFKREVLGLVLTPPVAFILILLFQALGVLDYFNIGNELQQVIGVAVIFLTIIYVVALVVSWLGAQLLEKVRR